ncbi:MAG: hypothetical protein WCJ29_05970 [bacterium]
MQKTISSRHWRVKEQACVLRSQGLSYRDIVSRLGVSKSSVSLWCRYVPLSSEQREVLQNRRGDQMKGIRVAHTQFWNKRREAFFEGVRKAEELFNNAEFIAGLMLYWAEGNKQRNAAIANSDEEVVLVMIKWFRNYYGVTPSHMSLHMHLHSGQDEQAMRSYWSKITGIPSTNFHKTFIKPEGSGYRKNILYHGTVKLSVKEAGSTYMLYRILGSIAGFQKIVLNITPQPEEWMEKSSYAVGG